MSSTTFPPHFTTTPATSYAGSVPQYNDVLETQRFIKKADNLAQQILHDNSSGQLPHEQVVFHHYSPYSSFWGYPQPIYYGGSNKRSSKDEGKVALGIVALAVVGTMLYKIGAAIPRYTEVSRELDESCKFKAYYATKQQPNENLAAKINLLAEIKIQLCAREKNSAGMDLGLKSTMLAGAVSVLSGLYFSSQTEITAGCVLALVSGCVMLFRAGLESNDKSSIQDAQAIRELTKQLAV